MVATPPQGSQSFSIATSKADFHSVFVKISEQYRYKKDWDARDSHASSRKKEPFQKAFQNPFTESLFR